MSDFQHHVSADNYMHLLFACKLWHKNAHTLIECICKNIPVILGIFMVKSHDALSIVNQWFTLLLKHCG